MNLFIHDPKHPRYVAHSNIINELLGLGPKGKVPAEGLQPRQIQGITVWADPLVKGARFKLRVRCKCPACGNEMPVGRLAQHSKIHTPE
jgi:hypothetical protein